MVVKQEQVMEQKLELVMARITMVDFVVIIIAPRYPAVILLFAVTIQVLKYYWVTKN